MGGYGVSPNMKELLLAMRDKPLQEATDLKYLGACEIVPSLFDAEYIEGQPTIYLIPRGSPEERLAEGQATQVKRATHIVRVIPAVFSLSPYEEDAVAGAGNGIGIAEHTANVLAFYAGNTLGLMLDPEPGPTIEALDNAYQTVRIEEQDREGWLTFSDLEFRALTFAFEDKQR